MTAAASTQRVWCYKCNAWGDHQPAEHPDGAPALDAPQLIQQKLLDIEADLASRQNAYESAAQKWHDAQRDIKRVHAITLLRSNRATATEKRAEADEAAVSVEGAEYEGEYEGLKAVVRVLEMRSMVLMAVLKSHGRGGS